MHRSDPVPLVDPPAQRRCLKPPRTEVEGEVDDGRESPLGLGGQHRAVAQRGVQCSVQIARQIDLCFALGDRRMLLVAEVTAPVRPWDVAPTSIQLALARGYRWLAMLESGEAKSLKEIAVREGIDNSYVSRMVNLTTLAPDIVAAILDDTLPNHITLFDLAVDPPALWDEQRERMKRVSQPD